MKIKENISSGATNLHSLDDAILSNFFSFFSRKDAALVGATCKRLHNIESKLFKRDYTKFNSCQEIKVLKDNFHNRSYLKCLPNGNLAIANRHSYFYLLDKNFQLIKTTRLSGTLRCVEICGDSIVLGFEQDSHFEVWDGRTGKVEHASCRDSLEPNNLIKSNLIESIVSLTDHLCVFICKNGENVSLYLFDLQEKKYKRLLDDGMLSCSKLAFLSSNSFVGIDKSMNVSIFELQLDQSIKKTAIFQLCHANNTLILRLNKELLLICDSEKNINVISLSKRRFLYKFSSGQHCTLSIIRLSNTHFATVCEEGILRIWDINKKACIYPFPEDKFNMLNHVADVTKLGNGDFLTCNFYGTLVKWIFEPLENVKKNKSTIQQMSWRIS